MAEPEGHRRLWVGTCAALVLLSLACGSAAADRRAGRQSLPPQAVAAPPSAAEVESSPGPRDFPIEPAPVPPARSSTTLLVIDPSEGEVAAPTVVEAAARERERRRGASPPIAVIDQKNLAEYAAQAVLTVVTPVESSSALEGATPATGEASIATTPVDESYWRQRGREIRQRWRNTVDQIPALEAKVGELRTKFYATDDPFVRDGQVKPEWDRALGDLEEARFRSARGADEVLAFLEEGRKAGALPGWLREGSELEPKPIVETVDPLEAPEAGEPMIYQQSQDPP